MPLFTRKKSSVARRIRASFIVAATVPLLILAVVSYFMVSQQLQERALRDAHSLAKDIGMAVYDRLKFVSDELLLFKNRGVFSDRQMPDLSGLDLKERTHGLFRISANAVVDGHLYLSGQQRAELLKRVAGADPAKPLLVMTGRATTRRIFLLIAGADRQQQAIWLGAELNTDFLWNTSDAAARAERVCILALNASPVYCNHPDPDAWLATSLDLVRERGQPRLLSPEGEEPLITAVWSLYLKPHYQYVRWNVVVGLPESMAMASIQAFDRIFAGVAVLAALLGLALGSRMIRSNLRPLDTLAAATHELTEGRFAHRVTLDSGDEFQQLGEAFNDMASQIGRQFDELGALAELDRALQGALSVSGAVQAGATALTTLIGPGRCVVLCHEQWEAANILWHNEFSVNDVSQAEGASVQNLGVRETIGPVAALLTEHAYIRYAGETQAGILQLVPALNTRHVKAEILLTDPKAADAAVVVRVADVLATTLSKLVLDERLRFQARHDWLTGLPNRLQTEDLFTRCAEQASAQGGAVGMLVMNLDRFKQVNDAHGHAQGDQLIKDVAGRLGSVLPGDCVLGRFGGDEFVVILSAADHYQLLPEIASLARKINAELDQPLSVAHRQVRLSASMGAAIYPRHGDRFEIILQNADAALRAAKSSRNGSLLMFSDGMRDALAGRMDLEQALKGAVSNNEIVLHYQPVVDAFSLKTVSAEALMRWQRPGEGLVMPGGFIEVAEDSGLIVEFGAWALTEVCRQLVSWRRAGHAIDTVSVNVSGLQLDDPDFENKVYTALQTSGLEAGHLVLEVTETALIGQFEECAALLGRLREFGVKVVVDDFGTGYASFKYLKLLPVDGIKIDRLFVKDLPDSQADAAIVASVVSLAESNSFRLVAEGIETEAQSAFLREAGVRHFQGFLFDRGLSADEFEQRLCREQREQTDDAAMRA